MSDSEFEKLEKAEQEVKAQISQQRKTCEDLRTEYGALLNDFRSSYDSILRQVKVGLERVMGDGDSQRSTLWTAINDCSLSSDGVDTSQDIASLHSSLKARTTAALSASGSTIDQLRELNDTIQKLNALALGSEGRDLLGEIQTKKITLEKEEEKLQALQKRYDRFFGERKPEES